MPVSNGEENHSSRKEETLRSGKKFGVRIDENGDDHGILSGDNRGLPLPSLQSTPSMSMTGKFLYFMENTARPVLRVWVLKSGKTARNA